MLRNVKVGSQAWQSVEDIAVYLVLHASLQTARRFYQAFHNACETLGRFPELGPSWQSRNPKLQDLRFWPLKKPFQKYLTFYSVQEEHIEIVEVIHGARDIESHLAGPS